MTAASYTRLLKPLAALVFVGGWVLAVVAFFVIGTQSCANVQVPLAGTLQACQDTTANAVIMLTVIGFAATVGSLFLVAMHFLLLTLTDIESNTRKGG
jgi:predicted secreted protein